MSEPEVKDERMGLEAVQQDRIMNAKGVLNSAARLLRLVQLAAPDVVIEREKRLILKRLARIETSAEAKVLADEHDKRAQKEFEAIQAKETVK
jgi:hypothetical protein